MDHSTLDISCFQRAIQLALDAEAQGNLSIGAVICQDGRIVAEGKNAIWSPTCNPNRTAEIEALRSVPQPLWKSSSDMTLYTTLEPCLMCTGAILLQNVGRVMYGFADYYGGASIVFGHTLPYFEEAASQVQWLGPAYPEACEPLSRSQVQL